MNPDKQRLIREMMNDAGQDARRTETLIAGGQILRRKRLVRHATRLLVVLGVVAVTAICLQQWTARKPLAVTHAPQTVVPAASTEVHRLTDDELLALFPDVPVGLATLSDGTKKLIFPRPGDEARFVKHL